MSTSGKDRDVGNGGDAGKGGDDRTTTRRDDEEHIHPEPLEAERPAVGVDDVIETFDREPPEHPVSDADAPPPFG